MSDLIERLRAATCQDRELEIAIWRQFGDGRDASEKQIPLPWLACYMSSLDAALTLVPDGSTYLMRSGDERGYWAVISRGVPAMAWEPPKTFPQSHGAFSPTQAIALTIAALLAKGVG